MVSPICYMLFYTQMFYNPNLIVDCERGVVYEIVEKKNEFGIPSLYLEDISLRVLIDHIRTKIRLEGETDDECD